MQFYCLPFQPLTASDVRLIASSVEHHPSLTELTVVGEYSGSLDKGAVEGMARRHGVEKLVMTPWKGECLYCIVTLLLYALHAVLNDAPHSMLHCHTHLVCPMSASLVRRKKCRLRQFCRF